MKLSGKGFFDRVKGFLKQVPGVQGLNGIRHKIMRIRELSDLIKENKIVVFHLPARKESDVALTHEMVQEVAKEWLDLYGIAYLRKATAAAIDSPAGSILLFDPLALLKIPASHEEYLKNVRYETRKAIRLAEKQGFEFREFVWNDHLNDIYEINTSKEIRLGEPMRGWYREPVQPRNHCVEELQYRKYYGAFKDGKLYAYLHYWICGDFAVGKHFIGHAQHLKYGIMNALMSFTVGECIKNPQLRWLYYGSYIEGSLGSFKKHAGFQGYATLLDLEDEQELRKFSAHKVKTIWRI